MQDSYQDTYKQFRDWLGVQYGGEPTEEEWEVIVRDDEAYQYNVLAGPVQIAQLCHLYSVENLLEHNT